MTDTQSKGLQAKKNDEVPTSTEHTRPALVFNPAVDIFETDQGIILFADMPGVKADDLSIDLKENVLTLSGKVHPIGGSEEVVVLREYSTGKYFRQFTVSEVIDQDRIEAQLNDGVLRLTLPKVAEATPRRITVKTSR
jgi:HSP20 family molecular chaperone IbpA